MLPILSPVTAGKEIYKAETLSTVDIITHKDNKMRNRNKRQTDIKSQSFSLETKTTNPALRYRQIKGYFKSSNFLKESQTPVDIPPGERDNVSQLFKHIAETISKPLENNN